MKAVAASLFFVASALAQDGAASLSVANSAAAIPVAVPLAAPVNATLPSDFLTGYFSTINSILANSARPAGAPALPLLPGVGEILAATGSTVLAAPGNLLKGYFSAVQNLFAAASTGAGAIASSIPTTPVVAVGTAVGAPVAFPLVVLDPAAPFTALYSALARTNNTRPLITTLPTLSANAAADLTNLYNGLPAPVQGVFVATNSLGRGLFGAFTTLIQTLGQATGVLLRGAGSVNEQLLAGGAAAARDLTTGTLTGLREALATLPQGSLLIPVTLTSNVTITAPVVAKRFLA